MKTKVILTAGLVALAVVVMSTAVWAQKRSVATTIHVKGMHCQACAKKLMAVLNKVPGVSSSKADAKKGLAIVLPKSAQKLPSPRAQWEAVEKAGYTPIRLAGPFGIYTSKPRF